MAGTAAAPAAKGEQPNGADGDGQALGAGSSDRPQAAVKEAKGSWSESLHLFHDNQTGRLVPGVGGHY